MEAALRRAARISRHWLGIALRALRAVIWVLNWAIRLWQTRCWFWEAGTPSTDSPHDGRRRYKRPHLDDSRRLGARISVEWIMKSASIPVGYMLSISSTLPSEVPLLG